MSFSLSECRPSNFKRLAKAETFAGQVQPLAKSV